MWLDAQTRYSNAQDVTAATLSTNTVDHGVARNLGVGQELYVVVVVTTAFTDSGSNSTLTVDLYGDSTTTITPDAQSRLGIIPAVSAAGYTLAGRVQPGFAANYQYTALYYTPNNGNLDTGNVTAWMAIGAQLYTSYADGFTIS